MKGPGRGGLRRFLGRGVSCIAVGYATVILTVGCMQRRLLYHPPELGPAEAGRLAERFRFQPWTNLAGLRIGWFRPGTRGSAAGSVLITHGNAGAAVKRAYLADPIQAATSLDVYVLEYPGFAGRPGKPSQESLTEAAGDAFTLLRSRGPVYLVGESLGTGVACFLAGTRPREVAGVVLLTPFNNLSAVAEHHYPWLPVRLLLLDRYPSDVWLEAYQGPVGFVVGTADRVIPADLGRLLHDGYSGPKEIWEFQGESHGEASHRPPEWWREAFGFLRAAPVRLERPKAVGMAPGATEAFPGPPVP